MDSDTTAQRPQSKSSKFKSRSSTDEFLGFQDAYTDSPKLNSNIILGSIQLLSWLLFHPSAWRNHIGRVDSTLSPNFCLAELKLTQWPNVALWQLITITFIIWPLLTSALLWLVGVVDDIKIGISLGTISGIIFVIAVSQTLSVIGSWIVSVAFGLTSSVVGTIAVSLALTIPGSGLYTNGQAVIASSTTSPLAMNAPGDFYRAAILVMAIGLALGITSSVTANVSGAIPDKTTSLAKLIGGIFMGVLIGSAGIVIINGIIISAVVTIAAQSPFPGLDLGSNMVIPGGIAVGVAIGWRTDWRRGLIYGVIFGLMLGLARYITVTQNAISLVGVINAAWILALFALSYILAERIAGPWAGAVAAAMGSGTVFFLSLIGNDFPWPSFTDSQWPILPIGILSILLGLSVVWWGPFVFYPFFTIWNIALYRLDERRSSDRSSLLQRHSAFWDENQRLPLMSLDEHLTLIFERNQIEGQSALDYLSGGRQRWAAQAAQIELDARQLEQCATVAEISQVHLYLEHDLKRILSQETIMDELERIIPQSEFLETYFPVSLSSGAVNALLLSFGRVSQDVKAALNQTTNYHQRLSFVAIEDRLNALLRELTRSDEKYVVRFRPVVIHWREVVTDYIQELTKSVEQTQEIDNPYVIGVPLLGHQEVFVGRTDIAARIESLLLDRRRPPLLIYGQRRMGKTSLLNNLGRLLPQTIVPMFVDLQGPASRASDEAGFFYNLARGMADSTRQQRDLILPPLSREALTTDPFTCFDEWLDKVEATLALATALLALDEFESLESAFARGRLDEESVLGMLRHIIQHRPSFKILLAGSHNLDEVRHWANYLINVQVVQIGYLKEQVARQLIEQPTKDFALRYEPEASRRVLEVTRGHPFLVQLLCSEIVTLKNEQSPAERRLARQADVAAAIPRALIGGSLFFSHIEADQGQTGTALLRFLAAQGEGAAVPRSELVRQANASHEFDPILAHLLRRDLIEPVADDSYRFQVELVRRWFAT